VASLIQLNAADWLMDYYKNPTPELFVQEVQKLADQGGFEKPSARWPAVAFLSQVMAANPSMIETWLAAFSSADESTLSTLRVAAWYSHTPEAHDYFLSQQLDTYLENEAPNILEMEVNNPTVLDMLWGYFFATGERAPIVRLMKALELSKYTDAVEGYKDSEKTETDKKELYLGVTFQAAMWSLEANCRNYPLVLEYCKELCFAPETTKGQTLWMGVILSKVDPENYSVQVGNTVEGDSD
jgi:hypothetical protein